MSLGRRALSGGRQPAVAMLSLPLNLASQLKDDSSKMDCSRKPTSHLASGLTRTISTEKCFLPMDAAAAIERLGNTP